MEVTCDHAAPLRLSRIVELGLVPTRTWAACGHPVQPLGDYVCPCAGCGPTCPGYTRDGDRPNI